MAKTVYCRDVYDTAYLAIKTIDQNPHGIYGVDIKRNKNGICIPTEVNYGRFYTTNDFFSRLGVNTPYLYVKHFHDKNYNDEKIEEIKEEYLWCRGIDIEPNLQKI